LIDGVFALVIVLITVDLPLPAEDAGALVLNLDFGIGIKTDRVTDISGASNHGVLVNIAERAVRRRYWNGGTTIWTMDPTGYDAVHFHADDLYDAEWKTDFTYTIPEDLPSGAYAARLKQGEFTEYVTFLVAPPKGQARAKLALWLSTWNYLAYTNVSIAATAGSGTAARTRPSRAFTKPGTSPRSGRACSPVARSAVWSSSRVACPGRWSASRWRR